MSRNAHSGNGIGIINAVGKADDVGARIVMVGKIARDPFDAHAAHSIGLEDGPGGIGPGYPTARPDARIFVKGSVYLYLSDHGKDDCRKDKDNIIII